MRILKAIIEFLKEHLYYEIFGKPKTKKEGTSAEEVDKLNQAFLDLSEKIKDAENTLQILNTQIRTYKELEDVHIQEIKQQEAIALNENFYKIVLSNNDIEDIKLIKESLKNINNKDIINKLVWKEYYEAPVKALLSRLSLLSKVSGIYKITSLKTGKSYIGQSVNIGDRFKTHIKSALGIGTTSNKFYETAKEEGIENFTFEVLQECEDNKPILNQYEKYWIEFYDSKNVGLNTTAGGS